MNESLLSRTISFLRFPLIVGVVFIHSNMLVVNIQGTIIRYDKWPFVAFVMNLFSSVLADVCVPLFFFISGFLLFYYSAFSKEEYLTKIKKRVYSLLVPYLIWNFIAFIILLIQVHPKVISFFPLLKDYRVDIISFMSSFWVTNLPVAMSGPANPINTPLWFVRDLMVLVVFSPIIWWLIKKTGIFVVILLGIVWFFTLGESVGFPGLCHQSLFFFPLGAFFGIRHLDFVTLAKKMRWTPYIYAIIAIMDALTKDTPFSGLLHHFEILIGMITFVYLVSLFLEKGKIHVCSFLAGASFFVYALHNLFLGKMMKVVLMVVKPESQILVLLIYFLMPTITILLCLVLYKALCRFSPTVSSVVIGGR